MILTDNLDLHAPLELISNIMSMADIANKPMHKYTVIKDFPFTN